MSGAADEHPLLAKLRILADAAKYDASCASSGGKRAPGPGGVGHVDGMGICHSYTPDGRCVSLLKILLTNFCIFDCQYCVNRVSSDTPRARFTPEEVVTLTLDFYKRNYIEGLFLSSGVLKSPDDTMEKMIRVARVLREEHCFGGYIHLKAIAGASNELTLEAGRWADRVSANIEMPTAQDLARFAPEKRVDEIHQTMGVLSENIAASKEERASSARAPAFAPAGQSTQMVVGASETPDAEVIRTAALLYERYQLRRVYYSAFSPIPHADVRLPAKSPPLMREHRLYQADWLVRQYGFRPEELFEESTANLDLALDPKLAWALRHRDQFPVDVNRAPKESLLRVPGLGVRNVQRLLRVRRWHRVTLQDLVHLRVSLEKVRPFVITADHSPGAQLDDARLESRLRTPPEQLDLFAPPRREES